jgi:CubicO group peptidase (beta-lactamase class C family)
MKKTLDAFLRDLIRSGVTPCLSIAVVKGSRLIYTFCEGHEVPNDPASKKLTPLTRLNLGSTTKPVTGALLVKLACEGRLALMDPVRKYVPEFSGGPSSPKGGDIKLIHLLTHSSGYESSQNVNWPPNQEALKEYFRSIYSSLPKNTPGETVQYWSVGYAVIMDVIQRVTGMDIEAFAQRELFRPLGMRHTTYRLTTLKPREYILPWDGTKVTESLKTAPPTCDTALYSTAEDMVKFGAMFLHGGKAGARRVFPISAVDYMLRERTDKKTLKTPIFWIQSNGSAEYGCFGDLNSPRAVGHPGYTGCMLMIDPEYDVTAAILCNSIQLHGDYNNYKKINNRILSLCDGRVSRGGRS